MLMDKKSFEVIVRGSVLSAAFSFIFFNLPIVGSIFHFLSLTPLFYVGIKLKNLKAFLIACLMPLSVLVVHLKIAGCLFFILTSLIPSALLLKWHLEKKALSFAFSRSEILHKFSKLFLILACLFIAYVFKSKQDFLEIFGINQNLLIEKSPNFSNIVEFFPGISFFSMMFMVWGNYQIAYSFIAKNKNIRAIDKKITSLPNFWDIILVGSLWLYLLSKITNVGQPFSLGAKTILFISLFPLLIEGLEILRIIINVYKVPNFVYFLILIFAFLLVWPMIFVVALGLVEPWYGLKQKYINKLGA